MSLLLENLWNFRVFFSVKTLQEVLTLLSSPAETKTKPRPEFKSRIIKYRQRLKGRVREGVLGKLSSYSLLMYYGHMTYWWSGRSYNGHACTTSAYKCVLKWGVSSTHEIFSMMRAWTRPSLWCLRDHSMSYRVKWSELLQTLLYRGMSRNRIRSE